MNWKAYLTAAAILAGAILLWYEMKPAPAPVNDWTPAKTAPQIAAVPKVDINPPKVKVYAPAAKKRLNLPAAVQQDPHTHVLTATRVPADDHPQTVTTLIDDQTGAETTLVRREPLPWLAAEQRGELRLDYGTKGGVRRVGRLTFQEDLLQMKAVHAGVNATLDTDGEYFIGGGVAYKW